MNVLLFGGGFISQNIHAYLDTQGMACRVIGARIFVAEPAIEPLAIASNSHIVICAGITRLVANDFAAFRANMDLVLGFLAALETGNVASLTYLSSIDVYGKDIDGQRLSEDRPKAPQDYYSLSKSLLEEAIAYYCKSNAIRYLVLRLTGIYGPGDQGKSMISRLVSDALNNGVVRIVAPGTDTRDYLHVVDLARLVRAFISAGFTVGILNAATGVSYSVYVIGEWVATQTGAHLELVFGSSEARASSIEISVDRWKRFFPDIRPMALPEGMDHYLSNFPRSEFTL